MSELPPGPTRTRLDSLLAAAQRDGRLPTVVAGVVDGGGLCWTGAVGDGADPDAQYRIGSITKTLTAILVLQARRDGLLDLDRPLEAFLPDAPYADRTVRALLSHSAGIPAEPAGDWWERAAGRDWVGLADAHRERPALMGPDQHHIYSNLGYGLLGEAVARLRGESWWDLVRNRILEPLGMRRSTYLPEPPYATGWSVDQVLSTVSPEPVNDTGAMAPAGQVWSTVADLARYAGFLFDGHPDVLDRDTLVLMSAPMTPGGGYGLGFQLVAGGSGTLVGHTGTMPGFMAKLQVDRPRRRAAVVLANGTVGLDTNGLSAALLDTVHLGDPEPVAPWRPSTDVPDAARALAGTWYWGHRAHEAVWSMDRLTVTSVRPVDELETFELTDDGTWVDSLGLPLDVEVRDDGSVAWWRFDTYLFTRTPYDPAAPVPGGAP